MSRQSSAEITVWDPLVWASHWIVAIAFFVAYLTEDEALTVHVWAGWTVGALVLLRIIWGVVGPHHARLSDFVYPLQSQEMRRAARARLRARN